MTKAILKSLVVLALSAATAALAQEPAPVEAPAETTASDPTPAESAPAEPEEKSSRPASRMVEEIIVTAQKREENLQDVPISINAFSAEVLDARGITDPKDLPQATPGLTVGQAAGYTVTYLRSVGSDAFLLADPSVALYIDNVYFPFAHGQAQNFGSIERIEVLKGPQGTLFGRNCVFRGCRSTSPRDVGPVFRRKPVQWRAGRMYFG